MVLTHPNLAYEAMSLTRGPAVVDRRVELLYWAYETLHLNRKVHGGTSGRIRTHIGRFGISVAAFAHWYGWSPSHQ